jgi:mono/diheme cytochrome c family protein
MKRVTGMLLCLALMLAACSKEKPPAATDPLSVDDAATLSSLNRGARLFQEHCAQCHGPEAQGHPDWETPGVIAAAPPLNGSGNDWKRTRAQLITSIKNGAKRDGLAVMPAWKDRLSDAEIDEIVTWFQALWPADVYAKWRRTNGAPRG